MRKTFTYTYQEILGPKITLKKAITDRMEPRDDHKKIYAAACFTEMLRSQYGDSIPPVLGRNVKEA